MDTLNIILTIVISLAVFIICYLIVRVVNTTHKYESLGEVPDTPFEIMKDTKYVFGKEVSIKLYVGNKYDDNDDCLGNY